MSNASTTSAGACVCGEVGAGVCAEVCAEVGAGVCAEVVAVIVAPGVDS
jgi:hypothetical protein